MQLAHGADHVAGDGQHQQGQKQNAPQAEEGDNLRDAVQGGQQPGAGHQVHHEDLRVRPVLPEQVLPILDDDPLLLRGDVRILHPGEQRGLLNARIVGEQLPVGGEQVHFPADALAGIGPQVRAQGLGVQEQVQNRLGAVVVRGDHGAGAAGQHSQGEGHGHHHPLAHNGAVHLRQEAHAPDQSMVIAQIHGEGRLLQPLGQGLEAYALPVDHQGGHRQGIAADHGVEGSLQADVQLGLGGAAGGGDLRQQLLEVLRAAAVHKAQHGLLIIVVQGRGGHRGADLGVVQGFGQEVVPQ